MTSFTELGVPQKAVAVLASRGITAPFPIQSATIGDALAGRDLCGRAPTGSGKTLAFAIPLAMRCATAVPRRPRALVLVPTRELAAQVHAVLEPLAQALGKRVASFYGGTSIPRDHRRLAAGVDIAVACPGRLADLVKQKAIHLGDVDLVVVDEADRMADMGFLPDVRRLLDLTSPQRQTLLFSATLDGDVDVLVQRYQRDPVRRDYSPPAEDVSDVRHVFWAAEPFERTRVTAELVRAAGSAIVFTRTKHGADRLARTLQREGVAAAAIHANLNQNQRTRALAAFSQGHAQALVATDIAARGIHVDAVGVVVHYDPPHTDKDYVHRSGRTGRAGADGLVVTLVVPDKAKDVAALQRALALPVGVSTVDVAAAVSRLPGIAPRIQPWPAATPHQKPDAAGTRPTKRTPPRDRGRDGAREQGRRQVVGRRDAAVAAARAVTQGRDQATESGRTASQDRTRAGAKPRTRGGRSRRPDYAARSTSKFTTPGR